MLTKTDKGSLTFPAPEPPPTGQVTEIAPGILWARIPLPFRLNHINVYLIEDGEGWAVLDTGIGNEATRAVWSALVDGPLAGRRLTRLIVTHFHPDHIGLAGWLCERFGLALLTSQTSYLSCANISLRPGALDAKPYREFYLRHGLDAETTQRVATQGHNYLKMVSGLPPTFERLVAGDRLAIGGRGFDVLTGNGHAPEQVMLYCAADNVFLAADQVLAKITPNISVWAVDPQGDPLGLYVRSLGELKRQIPADALVLPGHQLPFYGLHTRSDQLIAHHEARCAAIGEACRVAPRSAAELVPVLFHRDLDPHQMSFAFSEVQAHINYMLRRGELAWVEGGDDVERVVTPVKRAAARKRPTAAPGRRRRAGSP
jgi:glyoxylase-like metal-dependent hydrolase (beta-lactamase superfamily II)